MLYSSCIRIVWFVDGYLLAIWPQKWLQWFPLNVINTLIYRTEKGIRLVSTPVKKNTKSEKITSGLWSLNSKQTNRNSCL